MKELLLSIVLLTNAVECMTLETFNELVKKYADKKENVTRKEIITAYQELKGIDKKVADQCLQVFLNRSIHVMRMEEKTERTKEKSPKRRDNRSSASTKKITTKE